MTAETILAELLESGIEPTLTPDGAGIEVTAGLLTDTQRAAIRAHKPELLQLIQESARITSELLTAAMRACDHYGDSPAAREQMRQDCLNTPHHLRADLLEHFNQTYPKEDSHAQKLTPEPQKLTPERGGKLTPEHGGKHDTCFTPPGASA